mgnify:FL=1|jgi:hypothetical protein
MAERMRTEDRGVCAMNGGRRLALKHQYLITKREDLGIVLGAHREESPDSEQNKVKGGCVEVCCRCAAVVALAR